MDTPITTTLNAIRQHIPREELWGKLLKHLDKDEADDEPLKFSTILDAVGVDDAYWCLRAVSRTYDGRVRLLLADVAEELLHIFEWRYANDDSPRKAIKAMRADVWGEIESEELDQAMWGVFQANLSALHEAMWTGLAQYRNFKSMGAARATAKAAAHAADAVWCASPVLYISKLSAPDAGAAGLAHCTTQDAARAVEFAALAYGKAPDADLFPASENKRVVAAEAARLAESARAAELASPDSATYAKQVGADAAVAAERMRQAGLLIKYFG